ncbi:MAG: amidohydrolase family protein [Rhizobiales bacterium]|nr:amidohydrolase family protein [Hyphomicrobiales bacterium]
MPATDQPCLAPDRTPRPPQTTFPVGACDTHAHICGPAHAFPYAEQRVYTPPDSTLSDYCHLLKVLGIGRAVLVQPSVYGTDNSALLDALYQRQHGLRGVAVVGPEIKQNEIRLFDDAGIRGVRLNLVDRHGERNVVPVEAVRALAAAVAPFGWHLEFLVNVDEAPGFVDAVAGLPVDIVVGHLGYPRNGASAFMQSPGFESFLRFFDRGRCWVKLTGPYRISSAADLPYLDVTPLAQRLAQANPERLLWGTDWPHVMNKKPMPNDGDLSDLIAAWLPDPGLRERVLVANPAALYGFAGSELLD